MSNHKKWKALTYATHFYKEDPEALEEWDAATMSYPVHVPAGLAALSAKEALPEVLHFFRQGSLYCGLSCGSGKEP
jgi:hypothetical protein